MYLFYLKAISLLESDFFFLSTCKEIEINILSVQILFLHLKW